MSNDKLRQFLEGFSPIARQLYKYARAGYPCIAVESFEEDRVKQALIDAFCGKDSERELMTFNALGRYTKGNRVIENGCTFAKAFKLAAEQERPKGLLLVSDFQHICQGPAGYRALLEVMPAAKNNLAFIVLVAPNWRLPEELKHEIPVIQLPLPTQAELLAPLGEVEKAAEITLEEPAKALLARAARGMTIAESENAFAMAAFDDFSAAVVEAEKMRLLKSPCLSVESPADPAALGGLGRLKDYITREVLPSVNDDQLRARGLLLVGIAGCGKSLSARVTASILGWPLVRFDVSAAKGSLVGQSESNIRNALALADAVSPCVLWCDEIEKAVGGAASSHHTDGGTTAGMVGTLLTWMQEHTSPVIVVATCNDFAKLPPELTRAGRFDERFFLDLPSKSERRAVAQIHLARLGCEVSHRDLVADLTADWTGAEIEQLIKSAARRTGRQLTRETLETAAAEIIPLSKSANVQDLRRWAADFLRTANDTEDAPAPVAARRLMTEPEQRYPQTTGGKLAN